MDNIPSRENAVTLLYKYTKADSLRRHALGVEQVMLKMAGKYGPSSVTVALEDSPGGTSGLSLGDGSRLIDSR